MIKVGECKLRGELFSFISSNTLVKKKKLLQKTTVMIEQLLSQSYPVFA